MQETTALTEATYYILIALVEPRHGYGIIKRAEELSGGRVRLAAGTLYGALGTMCEKGWIEPSASDDEGRRKQYRLTERGLGVLKGELKRLTELVDNGKRIIGGMVK